MAATNDRRRSEEDRAAGVDKRIGAFLFDVDGVLADTAHLHVQAWRSAVTEAGLVFPVEVSDALRGRSREGSLRIILGDRSIEPAGFDAIVLRKNDIYQSLVGRLTTRDVLPGALALIHALFEAGVRVAAVSASRNARAVLTAIGMMDVLETLVDGEMSLPGAAERYLRAARRLDTQPTRCVVVEDAAANIVIARGLGMKTIAVGEAARDSGADLTVPTLDDLDARFVLETLSCHALCTT